MGQHSGKAPVPRGKTAGQLYSWLLPGLHSGGADHQQVQGDAGGPEHPLPHLWVRPGPDQEAVEVPDPPGGGAVHVHPLHLRQEQACGRQH